MRSVLPAGGGPPRQMKNSFRTSAKGGMEQCCPRLRCEAFNLHWIAAAHRGKANQAAHDGGATRSIRAFSAEILGSGAVNASEVAMMHATAYRRSIFQLFAARARRAEQLVKHTSSSRHRRQDMVYHGHCQRPLARAPTDLVGTKFGGCRTSAMAAARKVAPRACSALIPVQHPSTPRLLFPCAFLNILFHNGLNKYLVDSYCTGGVSRTRITRTTPRCCYTRFFAS